MKKILYTLAVASMLFVSCKKDAAEEVAVENATTDETVTDAVADTTAAQIQPVQADANGTNPNTIMQQNPGSGMQPTTAQPQPVAVGKGMNPAHGQPGHRCDIAVGAPLNSPAGKAAAPQTIVQKQEVTADQLQAGSAAVGPITPTAAIATAPGMNPPHGQDGHVCSIAVGAPLPKS
jgi:hypothetical protein